MNKILEEMKNYFELLNNGSLFDKLNYIKSCFNYDINNLPRNISISSFENVLNSIIGEIDKDVYLSLKSDVLNHLESIGYRSNILTCQEHMTFGSTMNKYKSRPYMPIGVLEGKLTIFEANRARQLERFFITSGYYFNSSDFNVIASLESLDDFGNTFRNPILLDDDLKPILTNYRSDFPFRM